MAIANDSVEILITKLGARWADDWNAGRLDQVVELYADEAVYEPPHHVSVHGKHAIHEYLKNPLLKHTIRNLTYEVTYVKHSGDLAYDVGLYSMTIPASDGHDHQDRGKYLTVWKKEKTGHWKIVADCWSSDLPPQI